MSCHCPSGLLETPPRWHATIWLLFKALRIPAIHGAKPPKNQTPWYVLLDFFTTKIRVKTLLAMKKTIKCVRPQIFQLPFNGLLVRQQLLTCRFSVHSEKKGYQNGAPRVLLLQTVPFFQRGTLFLLNNHDCRTKSTPSGQGHY